MLPSTLGEIFAAYSLPQWQMGRKYRSSAAIGHKKVILMNNGWSRTNRTINWSIIEKVRPCISYSHIILVTSDGVNLEQVERYALHHLPGNPARGRENAHHEQLCALEGPVCVGAPDRVQTRVVRTAQEPLVGYLHPVAKANHLLSSFLEK